MITPYLKPFNTQGGTLYVFPSVSKDLTRTFVSGDYEFKFSHFACLNLPSIYSSVYVDDETRIANGEEPMPKGLYIETLRPTTGVPAITWDTTSMCNAITESLQNYVMNFETAILNGEGDNDDYDPDILTTVSEKVFWNWLQKLGAIKFTESGTSEDSSSLVGRTVQYIGNIDVMNTVEINGDTFEELYIHIPSTVGASTNVYFRTGEMTDNKNYLNKNYNIGNNEKIIGRESDTISTYGLSVKSFVDIDTGGNIYTGDVGHTIDFRDSNYDGGEGINNMNSKSLEDFEFNTVLIYYDIYEKTSDPKVKRVATNLYGVLFLEEVTDDASGTMTENAPQGHIQRYPKKKETVYGNGNSYALKLDLKVDTFTDMTYTYEVPNTSENVTSMNLYMRALEQLQNCIDIFYTQKQQIIKLSERIATLENLVMGIDSVASLKEDVERLYDLCNGNAIVDTAAILGLIDKNTKKLDNIMSGGKDIKLQFDTDVIQAGTGIGLQKSLNKVVINSEQKYSINTVYNGLSDNDEEISANNPIDTIAESKVCRIPLKPGENFAVIHLNDNGDSETNLRINIDEETNGCEWEVGQSMKLMFVCADNGSLVFADSVKDTTGIVIKPTNGITLDISSTEFEGNNLIEVVCVDKDVNGVKTFIYLIK